MMTRTGARISTILLVGLSLCMAVDSFAEYPPPVPDELILTVRETAGIARMSEVVRSGIPLPRALGVTDTAVLAIVDESGTAVPAEFRVLARWHAGRTTNAPIQWLLVVYPASVPANGSAEYRLVIDGSVANPAPADPLVLEQDGSEVTVDTGVALFRFGGRSDAIFDEIRLADGTLVSGDSIMTARVGAVDTTQTATRRMWIEHAGLLSAVVVVEGAYDMAAVGEGGLGSTRRYVFAAGSPTAIIRQAVAWEGNRCGDGLIMCDDGAPHALRVERVRNAIQPAFGLPYDVDAIGAFSAPAVSASIGAADTAHVRQTRRNQRLDPLAFDLSVGGTAAEGQKADGGMLAVGGDAATLAVALRQMHRYEPQALRVLADGRVAIDLADDSVWLGARQGMFATFAVSALAHDVTRSTLDSSVWAPLNRPLRGWPSAMWFASSQAVEEFPVGPLSPPFDAYDRWVEQVFDDTRVKTDEVGLSGLMTFGVYPRFWGTALYGDEIDCGDEPTPSEAWDDAYWCGSWTDYHNTVATAPITAMRTGDVALLDQIGEPGALRVLHTQIMQCRPDDDYFYCGQAPAGYGGYRYDFNSSHAYFDNVFLYYWLTGDSIVVETLKRGSSSMRDYLCASRPGAACRPDDPRPDYWAFLVGRSAVQWIFTFRFVGLASDDPSFLEDYESTIARAVTQHYVRAAQNGTDYGFMTWAGDPIDGPGTYESDQLWMLSLYDMNALYRLQIDTDDAPIGEPPLRPSEVLASWARTLERFGSTVAAGGDGTAEGTWPNNLLFTFSGDRIGGALQSVEAAVGGEDILYSTGKASLTGTIVRSAIETGDEDLMRIGRDLTEYTLDFVFYDGSPLGKLQAEYFSRTSTAVAQLSPPRATSDSRRRRAVRRVGSRP